jgi:hypothetical protein
VSDITPVEEVLLSSFGTAASAASTEPSLKRPERFVSAANTDLLFSLFNTIEEEEAQRKIHIVRRGR